MISTNAYVVEYSINQNKTALSRKQQVLTKQILYYLQKKCFQNSSDLSSPLLTHLYFLNYLTQLKFGLVIVYLGGRIWDWVILGL